MECDSIRLELVVMHGTYVKTCKWPTIFIVVIFLCTMLFTYVAYIIYSSGNYKKICFCLSDIKVWYWA